VTPRVTTLKPKHKPATNHAWRRKNHISALVQTAKKAARGEKQSTGHYGPKVGL